ncbi:hypothetical protein GALMADRAFT_242993 [Galerina marginata CBS 339.88]|uniref:Uncharacterized protein n=1 Tax=Galerina marginata (strain CBS 339.88) TaxID=685588 RepID=A0A067T7K6_GALM3|nr:hypothetical protein GALMADRAFT_242993 [Galerina marginata CBS 339.88]
MGDSSAVALGDEPTDLLSAKNGHVIIDSEAHVVPTLLEPPPARKPFSQPPPEILHLIFERTIPPYFMLDPSASFCLRSFFLQVLRQKKSLISVCWAWYHAALPFLYENVSIRRVYNLSALLRTLVDLPQVKEMIKTVDVYCHIPEAYGQHFQHQLEALFRLCPSIPSCNFQSRVPLTTSVYPAIANITRLSLPEGIPLHALLNILSLISPQIIYLAFHTPPQPPTPAANPPTPLPFPLPFPALQSLSIFLTAHTAHTIDALLLYHPWAMPALTHLILHIYTPLIDPVPIPTLTKFCTEHGARVRFLHLMLPWLTVSPIDIQPLLDACPALEHLALSPRNFLPMRHARVRWVDLWVIERGWRAARNSMEARVRAGLCALERVRVLPVYLGNETDAYAAEMPLLLPPWIVRDNKDVFECLFLGIGVRHQVGKVRYVQPELGEDMDEDDEDGEYVPSSSDSESESESESGSSSDDFTESDEDGEQEQERERDTDRDLSEELGDQNDIDALETDFSWLDHHICKQ